MVAITRAITSAITWDNCDNLGLGVSEVGEHMLFSFFFVFLFGRVFVSCFCAFFCFLV